MVRKRAEPNEMPASTGSVKSATRFFTLVFAVSVPFWLVDPLIESFPMEVPLDLPVSALMFVAPLIATLILLRREDPAGTRRLFDAALDIEISPKVWYVPILLLMPAIMVATYGLMHLFGKPVPEPRIQIMAIPLISLIFFVSAAAEEIGWMGYGLRLLPSHWSALRAALVIGMIWAVWHIIPYAQAGHPPSWIVWQCIATVSLRILIFWLYYNTGARILTATLFHASINVNNALFPYNGSHYDPVIAGAVLAVTAAVVTYLWGARTLTAYRYA